MKPRDYYKTVLKDNKPILACSFCDGGPSVYHSIKSINHLIACKIFQQQRPEEYEEFFRCNGAKASASGELR